MKYLKLFESFELEKLTQVLGITQEEIEECFLEIKDEEWIIRINFDYIFRNPKVDKENSIFSLNKVPQIQIRILKIMMKNGENYQKLMDSDIYKEAINRLKDRLDDSNLFIEKEFIERIEGGGSQVKILIYRKSDENLIK